MDTHSSDAFLLFSAARARTQRARQFSKIRELVEAVKSAGLLTLEEQAKALGLSRSTVGPFVRLAIKLPAFQRRSSIVCWPRRSCHRLPEPRSSNTSRKKLLAYTAAAGVNAVSSLRGFQSRNCRYAGKLSPLSFRSTTGSPVRTARGPGSSQTADPALRS